MKTALGSALKLFELFVLGLDVGDLGVVEVSFPGRRELQDCFA